MYPSVTDVNASLKSCGSPLPQKIKETYDGQAETYDKSRLKTTYQRRLDATERLILRHHLSDCKTALEVGVGTGRLTNELLAKAKSVTAVDISEKMLAKVREKYPQLKNLELQCANAYDLAGIPGYGSFDAVLSMRMLPHIEDMVGLLQLLRNAVRPGGTVIADFWNKHSYVYWKKRGSSVYNHYVTYPEAGDMLRSAGLEMLVIEGAGFENPFQLNLELLGRTPLKRFAHSLVSVCRRPNV